MRRISPTSLGLLGCIAGLAECRSAPSKRFITGQGTLGPDQPDNHVEVAVKQEMGRTPSATVGLGSADAPVDPDVAFRHMRLRREQAEAGLRSKSTRQARKTMFFVDDEGSDAIRNNHSESGSKLTEEPIESVKAVDTPVDTASVAPSDSRKLEFYTAPPGAGLRKPGSSRQAFIDKLSQMDEGTRSEDVPAFNAAKESRRKKRDQKILEERQKMLVFRDVGMDLDKPILSRDVFLVLKYFRYGVEFAIDNELERMLRYFNEHALNELKIIQESKLMRGPATLSKKRMAPSGGSWSKQASAPAPATPSSPASSLASRTGTAYPFQVISAFPTVMAANVRQFCAFPQEPEGWAKRRPQRQVCSFLPSAQQHQCSGAPVAFNPRDESQFTTFSPAAFRRPAVVIYSQLGQKLGAQADLEWRRLAFRSIQPPIVDTLPEVNATAEGHVKSAAGGLRRDGSISATSGSATAKPIDVVSLRSMDVYKYNWVHRMYVRRFGRSLVPGGYGGVTGLIGQRRDSHADEEKLLDHGRNIAGSTFVGCKLLEPFYQTIGLRNYLSPHVMLVDHEGVIRWVSAGCPDQFERDHFPALLQQLEMDYYRARGGR